MQIACYFTHFTHWSNFMVNEYWIEWCQFHSIFFSFCTPLLETDLFKESQQSCGYFPFSNLVKAVLYSVEIFPEFILCFYLGCFLPFKAVQLCPLKFPHRLEASCSCDQRMKQKACLRISRNGNINSLQFLGYLHNPEVNHSESWM